MNRQLSRLRMVSVKASGREIDFMGNFIAESTTNFSVSALISFLYLYIKIFEKKPLLGKICYYGDPEKLKIYQKSSVKLIQGHSSLKVRKRSDYGKSKINGLHRDQPPA